MASSIDSLGLANDSAFKSINSTLGLTGSQIQGLTQAVSDISGLVTTMNATIAKLKTLVTQTTTVSSITYSQPLTGLQGWSSTVMTLTVVVPANTSLLVNIGCGMAAANLSSTPASSDLVASNVSFEIVGSVSYVLGSSNTSATLWRDVRGAYGDVRSAIHYATPCILTAGTYTVKGYVGGYHTGTYTSSHYFESPYLTTQVIPTSSF